MKRICGIALTIMLAALFAAKTCAPALAYDAYIDDESGIVIARGEAVRGTSEAYESAKKRAIDNARNNLMAMLERQYVDVDSTTIGELIALRPDKRPIVSRFVDTAKLFSESEENGKVKVSLTLLYTGPDSYQTMIAQLQGKEIPVDNAENNADGGDGAGTSDAALSELRDRFASKTPEDMGKPYSIALFDFDNTSAYKDIDLGALMADNLRRNFKKDRRFVFMEKQDALRTLKDNEMTLEEVKDSIATKRIPIKGMDGLIIGNVSKYEAQIKKHGIGGTGYLEMNFLVEVELRVLDAKTGRWLFFETIPININERTFTLKSADDAANFISEELPESDKGLAGRAFKEATTQVDRTIRASFPLEGYILKSSGDNIYISLTKTDGIKEGDLLIVYRIGDILTDPVTGRVVDRIRDRIGDIRVIDVKDTYSQAKTEDLFGGQPAAGDIVTLK